jgi:hypothetical protein
MKQRLLLLSSLLLMCGSMMGQTTVKQTVTIDGQIIEKSVTNISFSGDNVRLKYTDGTETEADMETVRLSFNYSEPTGIQEPTSNTPILKDKVAYNLSGQRVEMLKKGIYVIDGKKVVIK